MYSSSSGLFQNELWIYLLDHGGNMTQFHEKLEKCKKKLSTLLAWAKGTMVD